MEAATLYTIESEPLHTLLSVPQGPAPAEGWPVLCFLHGYSEAAPMAIRQALTRHGPLHQDNAPAVARFLVVAPQLPVPGDIWHRYAEDVRQLVAAVQAQHHGDPRRRYLTGFSYGGNGVFDLGRDQPDLWAALWPVDPPRPPQEDLRQPVWLSVGDAARPRQADFNRVLGLQPVADPPTGDRLTLDQGENHPGSARRAYADARIYDWLLDRYLPSLRTP